MFCINESIPWDFLTSHVIRLSMTKGHLQVNPGKGFEDCIKVNIFSGDSLLCGKVLSLRETGWRGQAPASIISYNCTMQLVSNPKFKDSLVYIESSRLARTLYSESWSQNNTPQAMVVNTLIPALERQKQVGLCKFQARLVFRANSRTARLRRKTVSLKKEKERKKNLPLKF